MVRPLVVPNPKVTLVINDDIQGWTESHFYTASVPLSDNGLYLAAKDLARWRVVCLDGVHARLVDVRMSLDNVNHDSKHLDPIDLPVPSDTTGYFAQGGPNASLSSSWSYQTSQVSWPIIMGTSQNTTNPILYIAGMPASDNQIGPLPADVSAPPSPFAYLQTYANYLITASKWGALARVWSNTSYLVTVAPIFTPGAGGTPNTLTFSLAGAPVSTIFPIGSYVRLQGATYTTPQRRIRLNGTYTVLEYTAGVLTVAVPRLLLAPTWFAFGAINPSTPGVIPYTNATYRKITHKKRGHPLYVARGRR